MRAAREYGASARFPTRLHAGPGVRAREAVPRVTLAHVPPRAVSPASERMSGFFYEWSIGEVIGPRVNLFSRKDIVRIESRKVLR